MFLTTLMAATALQIPAINQMIRNNELYSLKQSVERIVNSPEAQAFDAELARRGFTEADHDRLNDQLAREQAEQEKVIKALWAKVRQQAKDRERMIPFHAFGGVIIQPKLQ